MSKTQTATETAITIHAPHAGSDINMGNACAMLSCISIHAPHAGSDPGSVALLFRRRYFNPRSPRGERPIPRGITTGAWPNFNPRSPRGERHSRPLPYASSNQFQSTLPTRGATPRTHSRWDSAAISIHAPHAGSDTVGRYRTPVQINFNPRSPRGERRDGDVLRVFGMPISIHAPHAGSDLCRC